VFNERVRQAYTHMTEVLFNTFFGRLEYTSGLKLQEKLHELRVADLIPDTAVFLEHDHVYTIGKGEDSLQPTEIFGVKVVRVDRGGKIFYHGPGQLVVYFFVKINKNKLGSLIQNLLKAVASALEEYGLHGVLDENYPGVWIGRKKIAAIGMTFKSNVTKHGIAININPDLSYFERINTCGIRDRSVTSIEREIGWHPDLTSFAQTLSSHLAKKLSKKIVWVDSKKFRRALGGLTHEVISN